MPKFERGSYEPDDVRVFDGGADDDDAEGSHLPMVIVISLLVLAAFGGVVWLAYNNGVAKGRADVPPRIVAQNTDTPAAVPDSSEAPAPKAIKVYQQPAGPEDDTSQEPAMNKPAAATPIIHPAPPEAKPVAVQPKPAAVVAEETKKPVVLPAAVTQTAPTPAKVTPKPATPPAAAPAVATAPPTALTTPAKAAVAVPPPAPAKTVAVAPVAAAPVAASGAFVLQIGAYKSEADASAAWKAYQAKHITLLSGVSSSIQKADLGDKGVWYRLRAGSFADKDTAAALCERLKADGGACFPAK